jgi:hypothetical protein
MAGSPPTLWTTGCPCLAKTGYRSFLGCHADMTPGITPDVFAREMIDAYVKRECKGKLRKIGTSYVERELARREKKGVELNVYE